MKIIKFIRKSNNELSIKFLGTDILSIKKSNGSRKFYILKKKIFSHIEVIKNTKLNESIESTLLMDHSLGGGTEVYALRYIESNSYDNQIIRVQFFYYNLKYKITIYSKNNESGEFWVSSIEELYDLLARFNVTKIVTNNLVGYIDSLAILKLIQKLKLIYHANVEFKLHDYHCICPSFVLVNTNGVYCDPDRSTDCEACIRKYKWSENERNNMILRSGFRNIKEWRCHWGKFLLETADLIEVYSNASRELLLRFYDVGNKIVLNPHKVPKLKEVYCKPHKGINIGILGGLNLNHKGKDVIINMINNNDLCEDVFFIVIGETDVKNSKIKSTGKYDHLYLSKIIEDNNIDAIFIPSIWPETFSYTTSESLMMKIPTIVYNMGAQAEKVKNSKIGLILDEVNPRQNLIDIINFIKNR